MNVSWGSLTLRSTAIAANQSWQIGRKNTHRIEMTVITWSGLVNRGDRWFREMGALKA
jgi:hypothetical protein